jgi:transcriptional regulator with XRE-family HTH domain
LARVLELNQGNAGRAQTATGYETEPATSPQVEFVSVKRAVALLKRGREQSGMTLTQVADSVGLDPEQLGLLEEGDVLRTTLGTMRGYFQALQPGLGWTLAESGGVVSQGREKMGERPRTIDPPTFESDPGLGVATADLPGWRELPGNSPRVMVERGMTVSPHRRARRRQCITELSTSMARTLEEGSYAGV